MWVYPYDRAVHQTTAGTATILNRYAYAYGPAGNRTAEQIYDAVTQAKHHSLSRLLTHQPGGPLVFWATAWCRRGRTASGTSSAIPFWAAKPG